MKVDDLIEVGDLGSAVALLGELVRKEPMNFRHRTYLFALLCFAGDYSRAAQQLTVMAEENDSTQLAAAYYEKLLRATADREKVFRKGLLPRFLAEPPPYAHPYTEALRVMAAGDLVHSAELLAQGEAQRPRRPATLNGRSVTDLRDADDRLGPFFELLLDDSYVWVPLEQIRSVQFSKPLTLRDLFWAPVRVVTSSGALSGVMPTLYPDSFASAEPRARLGQMTLWHDSAQGLALGAGQRLFTDGTEDFPVLELQHMMLTAPESAIAFNSDAAPSDGSSAEVGV